MDTSFFSQLNWLAVAVASVAYFLLGALWYSFLFSKTWIKASGVNMDDPNAKKGMGAVMTLTFILEFIICAGLGILAYRLKLVDGFNSGIKLGLVTGICFCIPVLWISYLYQGKPKSLSLIDGGYHLTGNIIAAIILCVWR